MDFGFENIIDFTMNIDKLNLADLVGERMDEIVEFQILYIQKIYQKIQQYGFWLWEHGHDQPGQHVYKKW